MPKLVCQTPLSIAPPMVGSDPITLHLITPSCCHSSPCCVLSPHHVASHHPMHICSCVTRANHPRNFSCTLVLDDHLSRILVPNAGGTLHITRKIFISLHKTHQKHATLYNKSKTATRIRTHPYASIHA